MALFVLNFERPPSLWTALGWMTLKMKTLTRSFLEEESRGSSQRSYLARQPSYIDLVQYYISTLIIDGAGKSCYT